MGGRRSAQQNRLHPLQQTTRLPPPQRLLARASQGDPVALKLTRAGIARTVPPALTAQSEQPQPEPQVPVVDVNSANKLNAQQGNVSAVPATPEVNAVSAPAATASAPASKGGRTMVLNGKRISREEFAKLRAAK